MTIRFAQRRPTRKPPFCKASPPDFPPGFLGPPPPMLAGMARWRDLDPAGPIDTAAYIDLTKTTDPNIWDGATPATGPRLTLRLQYFPAKDEFAVRLRIYHTEFAYEQATWGGLKIDLTKPFTTGLLLSIYIPGQDYRLAKIIA